MAVTFRFARRHDRSLRLRVTVTGEHYEHLKAAWTWVDGSRSYSGGPWHAQWVLEGAAVEMRLRQLEALEPGPVADDLREFAGAVRARQAALEAAPHRETPQSHLDDTALRAWVRDRMPAVGPGRPGVVVDELGIAALEPAPVRVDVAHLSASCWTGVELKGERDSLARLPRQVVEYGRVFDRCTLVTTRAHAAAALQLVEPWWEVVVADWDGEVTGTVVQPGQTNPAPVSAARVQLLWREELWAELKERGLGRGLSKASRWQLAQHLAQHLDATQMRQVVTSALVARRGWLLDDGRGRTGLV